MRNPIKLSFRLLFPLAAMLAIGSCQSGELDIQGPEAEGQQKELREVIITASISDAQDETRTSYNETEGKNYWSPGDEIKVFSAGEEAEFTSMNTSPEPIVKFKGYIASITGSSNDDEDSKDYVWGLYPYSTGATYAEPDGISRTAKITTTYPDVQVGVAGTFGDNLAVMIGRSESLSIPFRGAYSGAFFKVSRSDIVSMTLKGLNNEVLVGRATIGLDNNLLPVVEEVTDGKTAVTVTAPNGTFEPDKNYYIITLPDVALPNGYSVTLRRSDGYEGTYELRANRPLNRIRFRNLSEPVDVRIENPENISSGVSTGWVQSATQGINEIWYTSSNGEAVEYCSADDSSYEPNGVVVVENIAPKDNGGTGIVRFSGPLTVVDIGAMSVFYNRANSENLTSVSFPDSVEEIRNSAFEECGSLSSVHFGSGLKSIGSWAFALTNIGSIDLPEGLELIGAVAFNYCPLESVHIPESVKHLACYGYYVNDDIPMGNPFWGCQSLRSFTGKFATDDGRALIETKEDGMRYLISFAPAGLESYTVPSVDVISIWAFSETPLRQVKLPVGLKVISDAAFMNCNNLTSVDIPASVKAINGRAFFGCGNLESIIIRSVAIPTTIADNQHYYNGTPFSPNSTCPIYVRSDRLKYYKTSEYWELYESRYRPLPETNKIFYTTSDGEAVTYTVESSTGNALFASGCKAPNTNGGIGVIFFTSPITKIDAGAFRNQINLTSVTLPLNVTTIGDEAFYGCSQLSDIAWSPGLTTIEPSAFFMTGFQSLSIPEGVTSIGGAAFGACTVLRSVTLPQSLTEIGVMDGEIVNPFMHCFQLDRFNGKFASSDGRSLIAQHGENTTLVSVAIAGQSTDLLTVPSGIEEVAAYAVSGVNSSDISLPDGLKVICDYAFLSCEGIRTITIPTSLEIMGGSAFSGCSSLSSVYLLPANVPSAVGVLWAAGGMFDNTASDLAIYVPSSRIDTYKTAQYWSDYEDRYMIEQAPYEIWYTTTDGLAAQYTLPDSYSQYAANMSNTAPSSNLNNPGIGVLKFPINLTEIPQGLFTGCTNLETVYIPKGVESIGTYGFRNCYNLVAVYVRDPGNLTYIGDNAFISCSKLKTLGNTEGIVNLPAVTSVGKYALYNMYMVEEVHFPNLVDAAAGNAFNCMGLNTTLRTMDVPKLEYCDGWYTFGNITLDNLSAIDQDSRHVLIRLFTDRVYPFRS